MSLSRLVIYVCYAIYPRIVQIYLYTPRAILKTSKKNVESWIFQKRCIRAPLVRKHNASKCLRCAKCVGAINPIWPPATIQKTWKAFILHQYSHVTYHFVRIEEKNMNFNLHCSENYFPLHEIQYGRQPIR